MSITRATGIRLLTALGSMLLYVLIFLLFPPSLTLYAAGFNIIPAVAFGWLMGVPGGFLYLLIGLPINILLFNVTHADYNEPLTHILGNGAWTLVSIGLGWIRDQRILNTQIRKQAIDLEEEVHERKQAQNALRTAYNDVERQVAERTEALNSSLEREQNLAAQLEKSLAKETQLQQMKTSIINNISHEFRTPLHIISMSADLLTEYRNKLSTTQSARYQGAIKEQIFYMSDMLQDILFVNSSDEIALNREAIPFSSLCHRLQTDLLDGLALHSNVTFDYPELDDKVFLDYRLVHRIVMNLFTNALKFSESGSPIQVAFGLENGRFLLRVTDQGIGILPEEQARIFDLFFRGSNIETRRGLGLGLNIVQRIVNAFGGTVTVHSDGLNQGSEFTVLLPATPPAA